MTQHEPPSDETLLVGEIIAPMGLQGKMKMRSYTDQVDHLSRRIRKVYIGTERRQYDLVSVTQSKPGILVIMLEGVTTRTEAENLRGAEVAILEREAAPLDKDEYFIHQLYGLTVFTEDGSEFGRVREVLETGANQVLVVARPGRADALLPMIRDVVQHLDVADGRLTVRLIPGLVD